MFTPLFKTTAFLAKRTRPPPRIFHRIATHKSPRKTLYKSQTLDNTNDQHALHLSQQPSQARLSKFDQILFQLGRQLMNAFTLDLPKDKKSIEIQKGMKKMMQNICKQKGLSGIELLNVIEVAKSQTLTRLQELEHIEIVYAQLISFINLPPHRQTIDKFIVSLWDDNTLLQYKIRGVSLLSFMNQPERQIYLHKIVGLVKYFKSIQVLILFYEKWRYNYAYSYDMIDQIHLNQYFSSVEDINQSYFKMLFLQTIRGQFSPPEENLFTKILNAVLDKPSVISHAGYKKLIGFMYVQGQFVQSQGARNIMQSCLNTFINIAKNQKYEKQKIEITELIELYLSFEQTNSAGEILLNELTYYSKTNHVAITHHNLPLFQQLLTSVISNIHPNLKYENRDYSNKEYTNDTLNFLKEFLPKYFHIWPQAILQLGDVSFQLITKQPEIIKTHFLTVFQKVLNNTNQQISLSHENYLLSILQFINAYQQTIDCHLSHQQYRQILTAMLQSAGQKGLSNKRLQILYCVLNLVEGKQLGALMVRIFREIIEPCIERQINVGNTSRSINSLDDNIIWLSLCACKARKFGIILQQSLIEIFVNEKLNYMINSLTYLQVYEILKWTMQLSRLKVQIYEKLLVNLSTFIISINHKQQSSKQQRELYLNERYQQYYLEICKLVIDNQEKVKNINNKNALKILQLIFHKHIQHFDNHQLLILMHIISDPLFLSPPLTKHIENIKFTSKDLLPYEHSPHIKSYQYYNKSILRFYEGKYNETEIKNRLMVGTLTKRQIEDFFSRMQVYKTIIMNGQLNIRFEIPEPKTPIIDFKYMYICQKIYQKIRLFNDFDFKEADNYDQPTKVKIVDLAAENNYVNREQLIPVVEINQFRIGDKAMPKYLKMQVWSTNIFVKKQNLIEENNLYYNNQRLADEILIKVIKGVFGSFEKIKQTLKQFTCNDKLLDHVKLSKIPYSQQGALIQFKSTTTNPALVFNLICTNALNYKILNICAYEIAKYGGTVIIIKQGEAIQSVLKLIGAKFVPVVIKPDSEEPDQILSQE